MAEARQLAEAGYTEIQLLGQNVNSYRDPSPAGWDFARLLREVAQVPGLRRVRFTTSHPRDFVKEIIEAIDENPVLCNHVHLPVQAGSDRVLERMQRLYTFADYMRRIEWMKRSPRNISITTDIIVGFPGESDADFERTLQLMDQVEYDSMFSFKYSPRPNTSALTLDDQIPEQEKSRRLTIVQEKQRGIQIRKNSELVGELEEVMVEGFNAATGQWIGRTSQNRTLNFVAPGMSLEPGRFMDVRVTRAGPNSLAGEAVPPGTGAPASSLM
jgi:tRNA-2-methylthio-N6-dimethylallyladenosine synthase